MAWDTLDLEDGPVPLWFQIGDRLRTEIQKGAFAPGAVLPSEAVLNRRFGVSRTTARSALDQLENEGLIKRRSGKGSIVQPPRVDQPLNLLASFAEDMRARGLTPSYRTLGVASVRVRTEVAVALGIDRGERVLSLERLLCADGSPIALSHSWIPQSLLSDHASPTMDELNRGSLYEWLEDNCGVRIASGGEFIEAATAEADLAAALDISRGDPVLRARRTSRTSTGLVVEYAVLNYRADRYRFRVEMVRP